MASDEAAEPAMPRPANPQGQAGGAGASDDTMNPPKKVDWGTAHLKSG